MTLVIGIDTGGTYTDGVVFDLKEKKTLAKTKQLTTYEDLTIGVRACLEELELNRFAEIKLIALSTTLATNAVVEGRGSAVGVILIGEKPLGLLPVKYCAVLPGGHDIKGNPKEELDLKKAREVLTDFKDKVQAVAISGFASVRNPEHELKIKELVKEIMDLPVVCGHELTTSLGFHERTVTAALNARLIPIISNLISSVKDVLKEKGLKAKLMIVKGDGSLMNEETAVEKPIETILSGPAASIIGATTLTMQEKALVLDMGGTTSDLAVIEKGSPKLNPEGAMVGGWLTRVKAADIRTLGLGGDSHLRLDKNLQLLIGPQKVWPLSVIGYKYPYLLEELKLQQQNLSLIRISNATDCYMLVRQTYQQNLTTLDKRVIEVLKEGPHSLFHIAKAVDKNPFTLGLQTLVQSGILAKISLTPTDVLHVTGEYTRWEKGIAWLGVIILASLKQMAVDEFTRLVKESLEEKLCLSVLESLMLNEGAPKELLHSPEKSYFITKALRPKKEELFTANLRLQIPIVGIGAPVGAFLPEVAKKLETELIIPPDWDVANAIGAAAGNVTAKVKVLINNDSGGYVIFAPWERKLFTDLEDAKEYGLSEARKRVLLELEKAGGGDCQVIETSEDRYTNGNYGIFLETKIEVSAIGRPKW